MKWMYLLLVIVMMLCSSLSPIYRALEAFIQGRIGPVVVEIHF